MKRHLLAAAAASMVLAGPAAAKTVHHKLFRSPSGQITCNAVKYGGKGIQCSAEYLPAIGEFDPYLGLEPRGKTRYAQRSDFAGFPNARSRTMRYGDVWKRKGIRCKMEQSGLTCRNRSKHGFHLAKGDIRRF